MMAALSLIAQLIGIGFGVYLMFTRSFSAGVAMLAVVGVGHFAFFQLSDALMKVHQRRMSAEEIDAMEWHAMMGQVREGTPRAWTRIASACGLAYVTTIGVSNWFFLIP